MLSQTALFHHALLRFGVDARLLVFEAMPHAHWIFLDLPLPSRQLTEGKIRLHG
jgi:hypothetical protein